ncbi:unnamed protein product [Amoebophrya sp. A120]|nr:unnamed protein product [Amoebophrya sp. A120]|eukprot:GSA120T00004868001.1
MLSQVHYTCAPRVGVAASALAQNPKSYVKVDTSHTSRIAATIRMVREWQHRCRKDRHRRARSFVEARINCEDVDACDVSSKSTESPVWQRLCHKSSEDLDVP